MMRVSALRLVLFVTAVLSIISAPAFASETPQLEKFEHADLTDLLYAELEEEWNRDLQLETLSPTNSPIESEGPTPAPTLESTNGAMKMAPHAAHAAVGLAILVTMAVMS